MIKAFNKYGIFLIIPAIVLVFSVFLNWAAGPYWLATNFDPSYLYFINGLHILKGISLNDATHPGTPLQILCGVTCWLFNIGRSTEDTIAQSLVAPEFYLHVVFYVILMFTFLTSIVLAVYVFRKTGDRLAALLTQLPVLIFLILKSWESPEPILPIVANVSPEPLLIGVLNLFNTCLFMSFFSKNSKDKISTTLLWGFVGGFGTAVKLTFLPLFVVPLMVLPRMNKIYFMSIFAATFFLWTIPAYPKFALEWSWVSGFIMHGGHFQSEQSGPGVIHNFCKNGMKIMIDYWVFSGLIIFSLIVLAHKLLNKKWDKACLFLSAVILGILFQFSIVTQNPGAHYLTPGLGLFGALLTLFYLQSVDGQILYRKIAFGFILIGTSVGIFQASVYCLKLGGLTHDIQSFHDHVSQKYQDCTVIDYYRSSDSQAALFFGDGWNLSLDLKKELFRLYPNKLFFHIWGNRIMNFNDRIWSNDLMAQNSCVLFRGDGKFDFSNGPYDVQLLEQGRFESIHLLKASTEKQTAILMAAAAQFFQAGDFKKALICALQAKKFHYQPQSAADGLIQLLENR